MNIQALSFAPHVRASGTSEIVQNLWACVSFQGFLGRGVACCGEKEREECIDERITRNACDKSAFSFFSLVCLSLSLCLSVCLSLSLSFSLSVCLSLSLHLQMQFILSQRGSWKPALLSGPCNMRAIRNSVMLVPSLAPGSTLRRNHTWYSAQEQ